jgi:hypothetical protein
MNKHLRLVALLFLCGSGLWAGCSKTVAPPVEPEMPTQSDSLALVALYQNTGGAQWTRRWTLSRPVAQWAGVTVADGRVVALNLGNNNLTGALPEDIGTLNQLQYLLLNSNRLTGALPAGINRLTGLMVLDVSENELTGAIPDMAALTEIRMLDLSDNRFTAAPLPTFLAGCTQLEDLRLSRTNRTGALPDEWKALVHLHTLDLSRNSFAGALPDWATMIRLRTLYLYRASLSGAIPAFVAQLPALEWLALDGNTLTGAIPDGSYPRLEKLWLIDNQLTGNVPAVLRNHPRWSSFHVCSGNSLNNCTGDDANPADRIAGPSPANRPDMHEKPNKSAYLPPFEL